MDDQKQADVLWTILSRVVAGLSAFAAVVGVIRGAFGIASKSQAWLQEQIRAAFRKELE